MKNEEQVDQIFGIRAVIEAINSDKEISKVLIKKGLQADLFHELYTQLKSHEIPFQVVPSERFNKFPGKNHQGVVAFVSPVQFYHLEQIIPGLFEHGRVPFILILDKVNDVRNFGAIARTAECSGVDAIVIPAKASAPINADAVKTSAGALHHIKVCREKDLSKSINFLRESGLQIVASTEKADDNYYQIDFKKPTALIMGSEEKGIALEYLSMADEWVKIPVLGKIESLNVSVATAVLCYECVKQRLG